MQLNFKKKITTKNWPANSMIQILMVSLVCSFIVFGQAIDEIAEDSHVLVERGIDCWVDSVLVLARWVYLFAHASFAFASIQFGIAQRRYETCSMFMVQCWQNVTDQVLTTRCLFNEIVDRCHGFVTTLARDDPANKWKGLVWAYPGSVTYESMQCCHSLNAQQPNCTA